MPGEVVVGEPGESSELFLELQQQVQELLDKGDTTGALRLIEHNAGQLLPGDLTQLTQMLSGVKPAAPPEDPEMSDYIADRDQERADRQSKLNAEAQTAAQDPNSPGGVRVTPEEEAAAGEAGAEITKPEFVEPNWILDLNGAPMTPEQRERLVAYVNFFYGADFDTFEQLAASGYLDEATAQNMQDVTAAIQDDEVFQAFSWTLPSGDVFTVKADEWQATQATYGLDAKQLKGLINIADKYNLRNGPTRLNWQPVVALAQATGMLESLLPKTVTRVIGGPGSNDMGVSMPRVVDVDLPQDPDKAGTFNRPIGPNVNMGILRGERIQIQTRFSFREIIEEFQKGLEMYNFDPGMAYIHALDPTLAGRLATGAIPRGEDLYRLSGLVAEGGFKSSEDWRNMMVEMGYAEAERTAPDLVSSYLGWLDAKNQAESAMDARNNPTAEAEQEVVREMPDPARIDAVMRALYQEMFLQEPDEDTLARFRSRVTGAIQNAQPGESIDISARAEEFAREDPRYGQLYGQRPAGVGESEYRNQFRSAQASMLGEEVGDNASVLAGMKSGKYQTTVGAAAGTQEAWDNSTFLGRLARAAQVIGENT